MYQDKVWWITGASSGIGAALAESLSNRGAKLILSGRNLTALRGAAERCKTATHLLPFEATDFANIPAYADEAWSWSGRIDGLINNAGVSQRSLAVETLFDVYRKIVDIDLMGPIALTQALLPKMVKAGGGSIIGISSLAGIAGVPLRSAYCAAKHGLIGYHDSVRAETAHLGMRVLVVAPGSVRTNVSRNALDATANTRGVSDAAIDNGMDPTMVAERILDALASGERELILAEGMEAFLAGLRRTDPNTLFDQMALMVQGGYAEKMGAGQGARGEEPKSRT
jgi:dehydrogenase/reductase SDR family member 7B